MTIQRPGNPTLKWDNRDKLIVAGHTHYHAVEPEACLPAAPLIAFPHAPTAAKEEDRQSGVVGEDTAAHNTVESLLTDLAAGNATPDIVICGDAYDAIEKVMELGKIPVPQLVYIDPPYNLSLIHI